MARTPAPPTLPPDALPGDDLPADMLPVEDIETLRARAAEADVLRAELQARQGTHVSLEDMERVLDEKLAAERERLEREHKADLLKQDAYIQDLTRAARAADRDDDDREARGNVDLAQMLKTALGEPQRPPAGPRVPCGRKGTLRIKWVPANGNHTASVQTQRVGTRDQRPASGYPLRVPRAGGMGLPLVVAPNQIAVIDREAHEYLLAHNKAYRGYVDCGSLLVLGDA